jgi:hypothetical protein
LDAEAVMDGSSNYCSSCLGRESLLPRNISISGTDTEGGPPARMLCCCFARFLRPGYGAMLRASMGMGFQDGGASDSLAGGGGGSGRLGGQLSFSSRQGSLMSQISEMDSQEDVVGASSPDAGGGGDAAYMPGYPMSSGGWDDSSSALLPDSLPATNKRPRDSSEHGGGLAHQFSLPKTSSSEVAAIEKFLQFQDAVPCKVRAKRGCATHPRSIAERVSGAC